MEQQSRPSGDMESVSATDNSSPRMLPPSCYDFVSHDQTAHLPTTASSTTTGSLETKNQGAADEYYSGQPLGSFANIPEPVGTQAQPCSNSGSLVFLLSSWFTHLGACFLSIASFLGLVVIARIFGDRPLSDWPWDSFSINATVAALSTVMKGALMALVASTISQAKWSWFCNTRGGKALRDLERIDLASRGSWGSILWLIRGPTAVSWITVGALLTVSGLAFDVFSQQFISIDVRQRQDLTQTAHLTWAQNVSNWNGFSWNAPIYNGIFSATVDDLQGNCPTGNCTWRDVPTVGITGQCADITHLMPSNWTQCAGDRCNYTASPFVNDFGNLRHNVLLNGPPPNSTLLRPDNTTAEKVDTIVMGPAQNRILEKFGLDGASDQGSMALEVIEVPVLNRTKYLQFGQPRVTQCSFRPVILFLTLDVVSGQQHHTYKQGSIGRVGPSTANITSQWQNAAHITFDDAPGHYIWNASQWHLVELRIGQKLSLTGGYFIWSRSSYSSPVIESWQNWTTTPQYRDMWAAKFAKSLSNELRIRNAVPPEQDGRAGVAYSEQAYIQVSWPWLVHPLFMLGSVLFVFVANILYTVFRRTPAWGTSNIMLLLARADERLVWKAQGSYGSSRHLMRDVGNCRVRLEPDGTQSHQGWTFREMSYINAMP